LLENQGQVAVAVAVSPTAVMRAAVAVAELDLLELGVYPAEVTQRLGIQVSVQHPLQRFFL